MFQNVGNILFMFGGTLFWVLLVGSVLLLLIRGFFGRVGVGIAMFMCSIASAFVIVLSICGFGKLIVDVAAIRDQLEE